MWGWSGWSAGSWLKDNWKTVVTVAAGIAVGVAVTALIIATAPVSVPALLVTAAAVTVGGFAGGVTSYYVGHWLWGEETNYKDALKEGAISAAVSLVTLGLGRGLGPVVSRAVSPAVSQVVPKAAAPVVTKVVSSGITYTTVGAITGAGTQVVGNAINDRPLTENVDKAATQGAIFNGLLATTGEVLPLVLRPKAVGPVTTKPVVEPATTKPVVEVQPASTTAPASTAKVPGWGGVEPFSPITASERNILDQWNRFTNQFRKNAPLVLTDEQLAKLEPGRMGPSSTLSRGDVKSLENFRTATKKVNDFVKNGDDLTIERIREINETLLKDTSKDNYAGLVRSDPMKESVFHYTKDGRPYFYADPPDVAPHLESFIKWYKANEGVLPPTELAGKSYQQLVRIHPFMDSNGRTTRLVMDWILQRNGLPPGVYTTASSEAVHAPTSFVVANTAKASSTANEILTTTTDTSAVPGTTFRVPSVVDASTDPSDTLGILGGVKRVQR